ncbi:DNA-binding transcriptional regulator, LacI/PurR family [Rubritalea squalenifaciens DSM 18772]|uniref:DNA-binding transcriptional regulator, LacI/PurR family n=1 Tax=Rubritalea squalenifaciens DSM 18772 TaxID=1123071 RepID=A0A1M6BB32_9BACT|nr:substrate-binding domain-containing protein [Rubritalea squalenifaciens]SHI45925.1 DNA-binding transcriptional regulator, LacI/PurR family [Rubritalea squalenifaciens DSM 18772]
MTNRLTNPPITIIYATYVYDERIHRGIAQYCQSRGWRVKLLLPHNWRQTDVPDLLGVISSFEPEKDSSGMNAFLLSLKVPIVDMSRNAPEMELPRFLLDLERSGELAASHLSEKGYDTLAYIGWGDTWHDDLRIKGFTRMAEQLGVDVRICWLRGSSASLSETISNFVTSLPNNTGIYGSYDRIAAMALYEAIHAKRKVPGQLGIIGSQNHEADSAFTEIPISTIDLNLVQQGYSAAEGLAALIDGKTLPAASYLIPGAMVIERASTQPGGESEDFARKMTRYILKNLNQEISVADLCEVTNISRATLQRKFKESFGHGVATEVRLQRMEKAKELLMNTKQTATSISEQLGYNDVTQFYRSFKRVVGLTAQEYRDQGRQRSSVQWA